MELAQKKLNIPFCVSQPMIVSLVSFSKNTLTFQMIAE